MRPGTSLPLPLALALALVLSAGQTHAQTFPQSQNDPVLQRVIELGTTDNQVMTWLDYATNRFGGRFTGSDAFVNATEWALWQFHQWGLPARRELVGEVPVGFNRGPWFGKMIQPTEKALYFGTPSYTSGTRGVQRGHVAIAPGDVEGVAGMKDQLNGAWVLIPGESNGFARDGRRSSRMSPLTRAIYEAGALGTIQLSREPIRMLDGQIDAWDQLPVLPDIKLVDHQYREIMEMVERGDPVELEFDIRNWFRMGPVPYHNVVAWIPGTTYPDEYVIMSGHFDCFDSATGAVDDGSGFSPGMEAIRLLQMAGARPKRTIMMILFAAEENGLLGAQGWLRQNAEKSENIAVLMNRDGSPSAIVGAQVTVTWYDDFSRIAAPLHDLNPRFPFTLTRNDYPGTRAERPGGTDASVFSMQGVPTLNFRQQTDYVYRRAWHTLLDTYNEIVPYTEHQQHTALVTAIVAYGIANLDEPLTREGVYLPDGLYADITTGKGRIITTLDYRNAPVQAAHFIRLIEGRGGQAPAGGRAGGAPGGGQRPGAAPTIGRIESVAGGVIGGVIASETQASLGRVSLPRVRNEALPHDRAGILGLFSPNQFYLTLEAQSAFDRTRTALGQVVAGEPVLSALEPNDEIRSIRIIRVGESARAFRTDDESFNQLLRRR